MISFFHLAKPGLVLGNLIALVGGFALGIRESGLPSPFFLLLSSMIGLSLVMASGCVFNNIIERKPDALMERTKNRPLVTGAITPRAAAMFGLILGISGFSILIFFTNIFAVAAAAVGFFFYVFMYSFWSKRRSAWGTVVGAISGATPPVVGFAAASNSLSPFSFLLFSALFFWQLPHFYAIGIRRLDDYRRAGVPILPVKYGLAATRAVMLCCIIAFGTVASFLAVLTGLGAGFLAIMIGISLVWAICCVIGFDPEDAAGSAIWARRMFLVSLLVLMAFFGSMTIFSVVLK